MRFVNSFPQVIAGVERCWSIVQTLQWRKKTKCSETILFIGDPFISMVGSDFTQDEGPPHPCPPPPRGEGWVGEDHSCSFLCNIKINCGIIL